MKAIFYYNTSEAIKVDKDLEYIAELEIVFKTSVSIKNPIIDLELKFQDNKTLIEVVDEDNQDVVFGLDNDSMVVDYPFSITDFNYCYIPVLERYYFIHNPILVTDRIFRLELSEDVLMSHHGFKELDAFIERNEYDFNPLIKDDFTNFKFNKKINVLDAEQYYKYGTDTRTTFKNNPTYNTILAYLTDDAIRGSYPKGNVIRQSSDQTTSFNQSTNYQVLSWSAMKKLSKKLYTDDVTLSYIKSCKAYPFELTYRQEGSTNTFKIGNKSFSVATDLGEPYKSLYYLPETILVAQFKYSRGGTETFQNFEPYEKYELFLPFHKWIDIDANNLINKVIQVKYTINYEDGSTIVSVLSDKQLIYQAECTLGVDVNLSSTNMREASDKLLSLGLNSGINLIGSALSIASGNPLGVATGILNAGKTIGNTVSSINTNYVKANAVASGGVIGLYNYYKVMIRFTWSESVGYDDDFAKQFGKPLHETRNLSNLHGFTKIGDIHLENIKAFENEKIELYDLLKSGIIL